jgi:hypothetical protein
MKFTVGIFAELFTDLDMPLLGGAIYIGHGDIDNYSSRIGTHNER